MTGRPPEKYYQGGRARPPASIHTVMTLPVADQRTRLGEAAFTALSQAVNLPDFVRPWLDRFYEPREIELLLLLALGPLDADRIRKALNLDADFLDRAVRRAVIDRDGDGCYRPADFHDRLEIWALFEGWLDLPPEVRRDLDAWEFACYEAENLEVIEGLRQGHLPGPDKVWPRRLLLAEAEKAVDRAEHVYLWPCNCRALAANCDKPLHICLRFTNNRGLGWEISRDRAKSLLRRANREGLMHSGEFGLEPDGSLTGAICNCCRDCCYPHRLADRRQAENLWPLARRRVARWEEKCIGCGLCSQRCSFGAFERIGPRSLKSASIRLIQGLCRGCGLCADTCPTGALEMVPLPGAAPFLPGPIPAAGDDLANEGPA